MSLERIQQLHDAALDDVTFYRAFLDDKKLYVGLFLVDTSEVWTEVDVPLYARVAVDARRLLSENVTLAFPRVSMPFECNGAAFFAVNIFGRPLRRFTTQHLRFHTGSDAYLDVPRFAGLPFGYSERLFTIDTRKQS